MQTAAIMAKSIAVVCVLNGCIVLQPIVGIVLVNKETRVFLYIPLY